MYTSKIRLLADMTTRDLNTHMSSASETIGKIASGKRSPSAKSDVVSLAISNQLSSEIAALNQGVRNLSQGSSVINVASGGISQISDVLTRMKALAVQASSDVLGGSERGLVNDEFQRLSETIDNIAESVKFTGSKLLVDGKVEGTTHSGRAFISANPGVFGMSDDATDNTVGFFDLHKTQSTQLASGYVSFNGGEDHSSVVRQDDGKIEVVLGGQVFEVDPAEVAPDASLMFREVNSDSYFSLQLKNDVSSIDTGTELVDVLGSFFGHEDTLIRVGAQPPLSSGWTGIKYDTTIGAGDDIWAAQTGEWTFSTVKNFLNEKTLTVSPAMSGLSGAVEEVFAAKNGDTYAISIKVGNELFVSTVDSLNTEILTDIHGGGAIGHKIKFESLENADRVISWELLDGVRDELIPAPAPAAVPNFTALTDALAEGIGFAIGAESIGGGTATTRAGTGANLVYSDLEYGTSPKIARFAQTGVLTDAGNQQDAIGFYTNFNTLDAANNPNTAQSIGNDFLLNTARTRGNISGLVESVAVEPSGSGNGNFDVTVVIDGRSFVSKGFRPEDQPNLNTQTTISHGTVAALTISSGFFDQSQPQTLNLVDANEPNNQISLNLAHNAGSVLTSEDVLRNSLEGLFGVGAGGKNTAAAYFTSGSAAHDDVNGFVSGGSQSSIMAYPGTHEGTYYVSYDADSKTFSMNGNGESWEAELTSDVSIDNIVSFGNGIALNLGRTNNEFDSSVSMGQFAVEITHDNIKTYEYQIGSEIKDTIAFKLGGLSGEALGLDNISISSKDEARKAQRVIDGALIGMNNILTNLGSQQSYTELAITNVKNITIWTQATRADFSDANLATELIQFNKETVITQAASSMVRQAQQMFSQLNDILR